jgi:hypothetical protein
MSDQQYLICDQFCGMLDCEDYVFELMLFGWLIKKNEIGRVCGMYGREERILVGRPEERDNLEDLGTNGRIIFK